MSKSFREDLTGQRFGRLTVLEFVSNDKPKSYWKCKCDCGKVVTVYVQDLKNGKTSSCGCLQREKAGKVNKTHGLRKTRIYNIWSHIKDRCYNSNCKSYKNYGGRGITICDEWRNDFKAFYDWAIGNGYNNTLTIDRIDVNGNYEPTNCRWVDMKTQQRNRRNNAIVEYQGKKMCITEASEVSKLSEGVLRNRYCKAGDREERLFRPVRKLRKNK